MPECYLEWIGPGEQGTEVFCLRCCRYLQTVAEFERGGGRLGGVNQQLGFCGVEGHAIQFGFRMAWSCGVVNPNNSVSSAYSRSKVGCCTDQVFVGIAYDLRLGK